MRVNPFYDSWLFLVGETGSHFGIGEWRYLLVAYFWGLVFASIYTKPRSVSAVTPRFPRITSLMRRGGTRIPRAMRFWLKAKGRTNSSSKISPGCGFGQRSLMGSMVNHDFDICRS